MCVEIVRRRCVRESAALHLDHEEVVFINQNTVGLVPLRRTLADLPPIKDGPVQARAWQQPRKVA